MVDLGWEMSPTEAGKINELELMVPSRTVRQYIRQTGYVFSDFSRAVLISNSDAPLKERYWLLEKLTETTPDRDLKREIDSFLSTRGDDLAAVQDQDGHYVYTTASAFWDSSPAKPQVFSAFEAALEWALSSYTADFELCKELIVSSGSPAVDKSCLTFGPDGRLLDFDRGLVNERGERRDENWTFPDAYCDVPNPFDKGDIVWLPNWKEYGVIESSASALSKRGQQPEHYDYTDVQMRVILAGWPAGRPEFVGYFGHEHVSPINMERYEPESWETKSGFDGMLLALQQLCRGEGSIATLRRYAERLRRHCEAAESQET